MGLFVFFISFFYFDAIATPDIYTLSLHDALPIYRIGPLAAPHAGVAVRGLVHARRGPGVLSRTDRRSGDAVEAHRRSEEHTSELQSRRDLVCRLLLEKKNTYNDVSFVTMCLRAKK